MMRLVTDRQSVAAMEDDSESHDSLRGDFSALMLDCLLTDRDRQQAQGADKDRRRALRAISAAFDILEGATSSAAIYQMAARFHCYERRDYSTAMWHIRAAQQLDATEHLKAHICITYGTIIKEYMGSILNTGRNPPHTGWPTAIDAEEAKDARQVRKALARTPCCAHCMQGLHLSRGPR